MISRLLYLTAAIFVAIHGKSIKLPGNCYHNDLKQSSERCDAFIQCANGVPVQNICPEIKDADKNPLSGGYKRLFFNEAKQVCDWPVHTYCPSGPGPDKPTTTTKKPTTTTTKKPTTTTTKKPITTTTKKPTTTTTELETTTEVITTTEEQTTTEFVDTTTEPFTTTEPYTTTEPITTTEPFTTTEEQTTTEFVETTTEPFTTTEPYTTTEPITTTEPFTTTGEKTTTEFVDTTTDYFTMTTDATTDFIVTTTEFKTTEPDQYVRRVCYGKGRRPGSFKAPRTGLIRSFTLRHVSGFANCQGGRPGFWNCIREGDYEYLNTIITVQDSRPGKPNADVVVFPQQFEFNRINDDGEFMISGVTAISDSITIFKDKYEVTSGDVISIHYGSHYLNRNIGVTTNGHCVDVTLEYF
ncbi:uncharacterized protein [Clytia hemisphaerica]|uniref:Uncharacterized protein n=1 Tax=Clytia hemisphaerica TaxID=252671 RepID=A0A7M5XF97_9CNID